MCSNDPLIYIYIYIYIYICNVVELLLHTYNMFGMILPDILRLTLLINLIMMNNEMNGTIPNEVGITTTPRMLLVDSCMLPMCIRSLPVLR